MWIKTSGFIPKSFVADQDKILKGILTRKERLRDMPSGLWDLSGFFSRVEHELNQLGLNQHAADSVKMRVETARHMVQTISEKYENLNRILRTTPSSSISRELRLIEERIIFSLENAIEKKAGTVGAALKYDWIVPSQSEIDALAYRVWTKASQPEREALKFEAEHPDAWGAPQLKPATALYFRVDGYAKKLLKAEKITYDFSGWVSRLYEMLEANYTQSTLEGFREFSIGKLKFLIVDPKIVVSENHHYVKRMIEAHALLKRKGFDRLWYGNFFLMSGDYTQLSDYEIAQYREMGYSSITSSAGTYHSGDDHIRISGPALGSLTQTVVHEMGHRFWSKFMDQSQRRLFNSLVQTNASSSYREFPSGQLENGVRKPVLPVSEYGASSIEEAFAEVFSKFVLGQDMSRDQLESFKRVIGPHKVASRFLKRIFIAR